MMANYTKIRSVIYVEDTKKGEYQPKLHTDDKSETRKSDLHARQLSLLLLLLYKLPFAVSLFSLLMLSL
jgi:hypothetical protein